MKREFAAIVAALLILSACGAKNVQDRPAVAHVEAQTASQTQNASSEAPMNDADAPVHMETVPSEEMQTKPIAPEAHFSESFTDVPYETPQEDKRIWGRLAYIMNGAGALGRLKPTHVRVYYGDRKEEADVLVGLVTSTTSVGGFKATKDLGISLNDGLYEMILVRATKTLAEFNLAATRALRLDFDNDSFISTQTGALRFEFDEPVSWTVDGEFGGSVTEVEIHNEHRAIDIVVP